MSICVWSGAAGDHKLSTAGNYAGDAAPVAGDCLDFPSATLIAVQNDLPAGTQLGGIDISPGSGGCVTITGNSFALPDGGALTLESGAATISANIVMGGELCAVVNPGCALTLSGVLSESMPGAGWLDVDGGGTLVVSGGANSYTGGTEIDNGSHLTLAGGDNRLPAAGDITLYGGVVDLGGFSQTTTGTLWFENDSASDPNTVQDGTLVLDNSTTEQGINACYGSGTVSAAIDVQGSQAAEEWALAPSYSLTIAGDVNFTHYDLFQQGGNTIFDGQSYTGDTFAVMGYRYRGQSMSYGTATFDSGNLTTTVETAAGYNTTGTIDWNSPGTITPGTLLAVGDGSSGYFAQTRGTVDTTASGCTLSFGSSGTSGATNVYNLDGGTLETGSLVANSANSQLNMAGGTFAPAAVPSGLSYTLAAGTTSTIDTGSNDFVWGDALSGGGGLAKAGSGTLDLTSVNTYSGGTTIDEGMLVMGVAGAVPDGADLTVDGTLDLYGDSLLVENFSGADSGIVTSSQPGPVTLTVAGNGETTTFSGILEDGSGQLALAKTGSSTLLLAGDSDDGGANAYTGGTTVSAGTLLAETPGALPGWNSPLPPGEGQGEGGAVTVGSQATLGVFAAHWSPAQVSDLLADASFASGSSLGLDVPQDQAAEWPATIAGSVSFVKLGDGTLTLDSAESYTGGTTVLAGTLVLGLSDCLPATSPITVAGGTLDLGNFTQTASGLISFQGGTVQDGTLVNSGTQDFDGQSGTVSADLSGSVGLTKTTDGTLVLSGTNAYTGVTTVAVGTLEAAGAEALPGYGTASALSVAPGATAAVLLDAASDWSDADLAAFLANPSLTTGNLGIDVADDDNFDYSAAIVGNCDVVKLGEGQLTLSGTNTYAGGTTVEGGTLVVGSASALGDAGNAIIITGGTLDMSSQDVTAGSLALVDGSVVGAGHTLTTGSFYGAAGTITANLAGSAAFTKTGPGAVVLAGSASYTGLTTVYGGTLELGANAQAPVLYGLGADIQGGKVLFDYTSTDPAAAISADMDCQAWPSSIISALIHDSNPPSNCYWWPVCVDDPVARQVTATYTIPGDANLDGTVNVTDLDIVLAHTNETGMTWLQGNFDDASETIGDGDTVDLADLTIMLANYNVTAAPLAPQVVLLSRVGANPTTANTLRFVVAFSQDVTGVSAADFQLACSGTTGTISSVVGYGSGGQAVYVVTVSDVFGNGTLGLNLADNGSIVDAAYPTLHLASSTGFQPVGSVTFTGQVYAVAPQFVWDGQGADANWSTGANWVGGQAPQPGSSLLFTASAQTATYNDYPRGTSFAWIEIAGNGVSLSGDNLALTGGITVDSGVTGAVISANIALDGPISFDVEAASPLSPGEGQGEGASLTDSGVLSGSGSLTKTGLGELLLSPSPSPNDYNGDTTVSAGTLQVGAANAIPNGAGYGNVEVDGALDLLGNNVVVNGLTGSGIVTTSQTSSELTVGANNQISEFDGTITGAVALVKTGTGTLTLGGTGNNYSGGTTVQAGTLQVGNPSAIPSGSGCVNLERRGMLDLDGNSTMVGGLSGSGGVTNSASGTSTLTVGAGDQTSQFGGEIDDGSGSVALVKVGGGTLTLTGDNSYSGGTTIDDGALDAPGPQDLPYSGAGGGVSVAPAGTLEVGVMVGGPDAGTTWASSLDALLANPDFTCGNLELDLMSADADVMKSLGGITSGIPFTFSTDNLGGRSLIVTGNSFLQLTGSGRYHGGLTLEGGATLLDPAAPNGGLSLAGAGILISGGAVLDLNGASPTVSTLDLLDGQIAGNPGDTLTASSYNVEEGQVGVNLAGGTLTKIGAGADDTVTLNGTDGYTGLTTVYGGALQLGPGAYAPALNAGAVVNAGNLVFDYCGTTSPLTQVQAASAAGTIRGSPTISDDQTSAVTVTATSPVTKNSVVQLCPFSTGSFTSSTAQFLLTMSEDVAGVAPGDFSPLIESDSLNSGVAVASVQGCGGSGGYQSAYVVTLDNISGAGSIGLQFQDQHAAVTDAGGAGLTGLGAWNDSPYEDHSISGQLCTWTGEGSTALWSNSANWLNGIYPSSAEFDSVIFTTTPHTTQLQPNFAGVPPLASLTFSTGSYTVVGGPITLLSTADPSIDANISVDTGATGCTISANLVVGLAGGGALVMAGPGTIELTGQNTFTGGAIISNGGTLVMGSGGALGESGNGIEIDDNGELDLHGHSLTAGTVTLSNGNIVDSVGGGGLTAASALVSEGTISAAMAAGTLSKSGAGTVLLSGADTYSGVTTVYAGTLELGPSAQTSLLSEGANIESGQITFDYSGADPAASVHQALLSHQIYSSTADADYSSTLRASCALGWIDNGPVGGLDNVVVKYTLVGDANCDGQVNGTDLDLLAQNWGTSAATWAQGDFYDCYALQGQDPGSIGSGDLALLKQNFGASAAALPPQVVGIDRLGAGQTSDGTVQFVVALSENVSGVTADDFILTKTGDLTEPSISSIAKCAGGSGVYLVTVTNVFGNGTLGLDLADTYDSIVDSSGAALSNNTYTGQVYQVASPFIWDGGGSDGNWSTGGNWLGGVPLAGSSLLFVGTNRTTMADDLAADTSFNSIEFATGGYALSGSALTVTNGITVDAGASGTTSISNAISGDGAVTMDAAGTLVLAGGNNSYTGGTTIAAGATLEIGSGAASALGSGPVTVAGTLNLNGSNLAVGALDGGGDRDLVRGELGGDADRRQRQRRRQFLGHDRERRGGHGRRVAGHDGHGHADPDGRQQLHRRHDPRRRHVEPGQRRRRRNHGLDYLRRRHAPVHQRKLRRQFGPFQPVRPSNLQHRHGRPDRRVCHAVDQLRRHVDEGRRGDAHPSGRNTYTGETTVAEGTLELQNGHAIAGDVEVDDTLDLDGTSTVVLNGLTGSGTVTNNGTGPSTLDVGNDTTEFDGVIENGAQTWQIIKLDKVGAGTLTLSGANTYGNATGNADTIVNAGTLRLGGDGAIPSGGTLEVDANGTLDLDGYDAAVSSLTPDSSGVVTTSSPGASNSLTDGTYGTLSIQGVTSTDAPTDYALTVTPITGAHTYDVYWGDSSMPSPWPVSAGDLTKKYSGVLWHTYGSVAGSTRRIRVVALDNSNNPIGAAAIDVSFENPPPYLTLTGLASVEEDSSAATSYTLTLGEVGGLATGQSVEDYVINWGDGTTSDTYATSGSAYPLLPSNGQVTHPYTSAVQAAITVDLVCSPGDVTYSDAGSCFVTVSAPVTITSVSAADISALSTPTTTITSTKAVLSVETDETDGGTLTYSWSPTVVPDGALAPTFSGSGKVVTATFADAGEYQFTVAVTDANDPSHPVTAELAVTVEQTLAGVTVTPTSAALNAGETEQFSAVAVDQFGDAMATQPDFSWSVSGSGVSGVGTIDADSGSYTAPDADASAIVSAADTTDASGPTGSTDVTVTNLAPTVAVAPAASENPVTGTTATLSVLGADDAGEANLTYTWTCTDGPNPGFWGTYGVTFDSNNGTNAGSTEVAAFTAAGPYDFEVTIRDDNGSANGATVTADLTGPTAVQVQQTVTTITVGPPTGTISVGGSAYQFSATATDQFGVAMSTTPASFTWGVSDGAISSGGAFTPPNVSEGVTVTASSGNATGTCDVTVAGGDPMNGLRTGSSPWTYSLWQQAIGTSGSSTGPAAERMAAMEGQLTYTLSASGGSGFSFSAASSATPASSFIPASIGNYNSSSGGASSAPYSWTDGTSTTYTAVDADSWTDTIDGTSSAGTWSYTEDWTMGFSVSVYQGASASGPVWASASGSYGYSFGASNTGSGASYSCFIWASGTASGSWTDPSQAGSSVQNPWSESTDNSDTISGNAVPSQQAVTRSGSGSTTSTYSTTAPYTDDTGDGSISGDETDTETDTTSFSYTISYSPANGSVLSGSASNEVTRVTSSSYAGDGEYQDSGTSGVGGTWTISGTQGESGSASGRRDFTAYYSLAATGPWQENSGAGTVSNSGADHSWYSGSGTYTTPATGAASGEGSVSGGGTLDQNGSDNDSFTGTAYYSFASGAWTANSGGGTTTYSGDSHDSYAGSGGTISQGDQPVGYAYCEDGDDDTSYLYTVTNSVSSGTWSATGSGSEEDSGDDNYAYQGGGTAAIPGGGNAAWTDNGGNTDYYGYTTGYDLSESGDWYGSGGSGGSSGTGQDHTTSSMSNVPYQYASPMGGKMKGTYNQNSDAHTSYSYTTTATYEPDEEDETQGAWTETGSQTASGSGTDHYDYSGSGKYSQSGGGWSASGRMSESGGYDDSYSSQVNYSLSSGSWLETSGTASGTGSGGDHSSYSGTGNYWPAGNGNTMTGAFSNSGSANTTYGYSLNATDSSGNWTWSGGNTYNEHDYGGDKYSYSGAGSYSRNFAGNNVGTLRGTTSGSGDGSDSYDYSSHYALCTASGSTYGQWQPLSGSGGGSGTATAGYRDYFSSSGSGSYWRTDAPADGIHVDIYFVQGSASESGSASDSGSCTTTSQLGSTGWTTTGSGSTSSSSTKSYSYSGAGTLTVAPANTNYSNAYGSMTDVRQNVADENGSGSITEKHAMGWSLASGATQWSGTDTGDLSSATSTATYGYGAFERYSFASGPASQSSAGSSWQTWSDRQTLSSGAGSISGSAYGPASTWNWQSGNGQAMENFASYECNYWMTGVDADANNYQLGNTKDSWSMPGSGASNTVQGSQWSDRWWTDDCGDSSIPQVSSSSYGPDVSAGAGMSVAPVGQPNGGFYYSKDGVGASDWTTPYYVAGTTLVTGIDAGPISTGTVGFGIGLGGAGATSPTSPASPVPATPTHVLNTPGRVYNAQGQLTKITTRASGAHSGLSVLDYDSSGNLNRVVDPNGNVTQWTYNDEDLPTSETLPTAAGLTGGQGVRSYGYDPTTDALTTYTDGTGQTRVFGYSSNGQVATETWYSCSGDAASGQNAENTISYRYNPAGQITYEGDSTASDAYSYTPAGELASVTEDCVGAPSVTLTYQYNNEGQRTSMSASVDGTLEFTDTYGYDSEGRVDCVARSGGSVALQSISLTYDDDGDLTEVDRYQNGVLAVKADYTYNSNDQLVGLVYYGGAGNTLASYTWAYDNSGLPTLSSSWGTSPLPSGEGQGEGVSPLPLGEGQGEGVSPLPLGEGQGEGASWTPGVNLPVTDTTQIASALDQGGYQALANVTSCTSADGTLNYSYDADGQLIAVATNGTTTATYNWDANGNPSNFDANGNPAGTSYVIGNDNELLYDGTYRYAYDGEGNCVLRFKDPGDIDTIPTGSNGDTDITVYQWDARGRLSEAVEYPTYSAYNTTGPTQIIDYLYDTENRWIGENICNGSGLIEHETRFAYDGNEILMQFDEDFATSVSSTYATNHPMSNANLSHRYLWQPDAVDQLMADEQVTNPNAPGNVVFPLADQEGTIHDLAMSVTGATTVVNHLVYDAFGNLQSAVNPQTGAAPTVDCLFGYTGRPLDPAGTGLQNNDNRWYSPQAMRWMSQDPLGYDGGDTNLYRYCGNSVTTYVDPTGQIPLGVVSNWLSLQGLVVGRPNCSPQEFFLGATDLMNLTRWGCGGLAAWRAGVGQTQGQNGDQEYDPWNIIFLKDAMAYTSIQDALSYLKSLPNGGLLVAVQTNDKEGITANGGGPIPPGGIKASNIDGYLFGQHMDVGAVLKGTGGLQIPGGVPGSHTNFASLLGTAGEPFWEWANNTWEPGYAGTKPPIIRHVPTNLTAPQNDLPTYWQTIYIVIPNAPFSSPVP